MTHGSEGHATSPAGGPAREPTPPALVEQLVQLMRLAPQGGDRFVAQSEDIGTPVLFGGQALGQSLMAACLTVEPDRPVHSMHAYFLLPGEHAPVEYSVERMRDGASFSTRHVVARQEDRIIFEMSASFQRAAEGLEHQLEMPDIAGPEGLASQLELRLALGDRLPERWRAKGTQRHGFEYRPVNPGDLLAPQPRPPEQAVWLRAIAPLPDDAMLHRALLAYASDHSLLGVAALPHGMSFLGTQLRPASLDHAMWFHRDFRIDDWLLYVTDSPSAFGARALCRGSFFTRDGRLVASTAQEGMLRVRRSTAG